MAATSTDTPCDNDTIIHAVKAFVALLPCPVCRIKAQDILNTMMSQLAVALDQNEFLKWTIEFHNVVNMSIGKPIRDVNQTLVTFNQWAS